jgi:ABC-type phosphate transport system ATPase subunit
MTPAKVPTESVVIVTHPASAAAKVSARTRLMREAYIIITITVPGLRT